MPFADVRMRAGQMKGMQIANRFGIELVAGHLSAGGPCVSRERVNDKSDVKKAINRNSSE